MTSTASSPSSYYDIDAILAEEELVPCTTLFDFSHLSHLDPDARHRESHLPEASQVKMPLWAMEKWATLGYVRLSLPRHYARKARERLEADPGEADLRYVHNRRRMPILSCCVVLSSVRANHIHFFCLVLMFRKRNERFFLAGRMLVDLIERSSIKVAKVIAKTKSSRRNAHTRALEQVSAEAQELRRTLVTSFAGERLRRTFDWALSSGGDDDVSHYLSRLTEMEQRLFYRGSSAVSAHQEWMMFGNRQWFAGSKPNATATPGPSGNARAVTPGVGPNDKNDGDHRDKRRRLEQ
jgi:hypothetical protein